MYKRRRMNSLIEALGQLREPELTRLRKELKSGTIPLLNGDVYDPETGLCWPMMLGLPEEVRKDGSLSNPYEVLGFNNLPDYDVFSIAPNEYVHSLEKTNVPELLEVITEIEKDR